MEGDNREIDWFTTLLNVFRTKTGTCAGVGASYGLWTLIEGSGLEKAANASTGFVDNHLCKSCRLGEKETLTPAQVRYIEHERKHERRQKAFNRVTDYSKAAGIVGVAADTVIYCRNNANGIKKNIVAYKQSKRMIPDVRRKTFKD